MVFTESESLWALLRSAAHWEFELLLMLVFDGLIIGICWPFAIKHWRHHTERDYREATYGPDRLAYLHECAKVSIAAEQRGAEMITPRTDGCRFHAVPGPESLLCNHIVNGRNILYEQGFCPRCVVNDSDGVLRANLKKPQKKRDNLLTMV